MQSFKKERYKTVGQGTALYILALLTLKVETYLSSHCGKKDYVKTHRHLQAVTKAPVKFQKNHQKR